MGKKLVLIIVAVLGALVLGGGLLLLRNTNPKSQIPNPTLEQPVEETPELGSEASGEATMEGTGKVVELTVEGSNFKFVPAQLKVKKGDGVRITFKNAGGTHDFVIDEFDVMTNQIGDGEEEEVEFIADKTGTFEYYCSVNGHRQLGMVGKLIVE